MPTHQPDADATPPARWRVWILWALPLLLIGPALLPGQRFLPQLPVLFEPLAAENPERAARAREDANWVASDALFPLLTDELAIRASLAHGEPPLWSAELGRGAPLAAGSMAAPWNPLRWPLLWMAPELARGWHALLALFLAGLGMLLFLEARVSPLAARFGALAVQVGGFGVANLHYLPKLDAALWLPWCLWAVDGAVRGKRHAELWLFAALACSALAGFPPIFVFVAAFTLVHILCQAPSATREVLTRLIVFAGLGMLAGALHLLPMTELAASSTRGAQTVERLQDQALAPAALLGLAGADAFGDAGEELPLSRHPVAWWMSREGQSEEILGGNRLEWALFIGLTTLVLACAAFGTDQRAVRGPLLALLVCLGFQFGVPAVRWMYALPGFDLGSPARIGSLTWFLWPWLAALGLDAVMRRERRALQVSMAATGTLLVVLALWLSKTSLDDAWFERFEAALAMKHGIAVQELDAYFTRSDALRAFLGLKTVATQVLILCSLTLALLWFSRRWKPALVGALLCGLLIGEGSYASRSWTRPQTLAPGEALFPDSPAIEAIRHATGGGAVLRIDTSLSGADDVLRLARPNLLQAYGIRDLTPYVALPDGQLVASLSELDPAGRYRSGWSGLSDTRLLGAPLLDSLNVTCVLSTSALEHERLEAHYEREGFHVYRRSLGQDSGGAVLGPNTPWSFVLGALLSLAALLVALRLGFSASGGSSGAPTDGMLPADAPPSPGKR